MRACNSNCRYYEWSWEKLPPNIIIVGVNMVWPIHPIGRHSNYSFLVAFARILHPLSYIIDTTTKYPWLYPCSLYALLALSQYPGPHIYTLLTVWFCSPIFHSVLAVVWHVLGGASPPRGLGCGFSKIVFSALHCAHQPGGWAGGGWASEVGNRCGKEERLWCPSLSLIGAFLPKVTN